MSGGGRFLLFLQHKCLVTLGTCILWICPIMYMKSHFRHHINQAAISLDRHSQFNSASLDSEAVYLEEVRLSYVDSFRTLPTVCTLA